MLSTPAVAIFIWALAIGAYFYFQRAPHIAIPPDAERFQLLRSIRLGKRNTAALAVVVGLVLVGLTLSLGEGLPAALACVALAAGFGTAFWIFDDMLLQPDNFIAWLTSDHLVVRFRGRSHEINIPLLAIESITDVGPYSHWGYVNSGHQFDVKYRQLSDALANQRIGIDQQDVERFRSVLLSRLEQARGFQAGAQPA